MLYSLRSRRSKSRGKWCDFCNFEIEGIVLPAWATDPWEFKMVIYLGYDRQHIPGLKFPGLPHRRTELPKFAVSAFSSINPPFIEIVIQYLQHLLCHIFWFFWVNLVIDYLFVHWLSDCWLVIALIHAHFGTWNFSHSPDVLHPLKIIYSSNSKLILVNLKFIMTMKSMLLIST
jgi:hypothetical protein